MSDEMKSDDVEIGSPDEHEAVLKMIKIMTAMGMEDILGICLACNLVDRWREHLSMHSQEERTAFEACVKATGEIPTIKKALWAPEERDDSERPDPRMSIRGMQDFLRSMKKDPFGGN